MRQVLAIGLALSTSACALEEETEGFDVGVAEQEVGGFYHYEKGSTTNMVGGDTAKTPAQLTCILSGVRGNLTQGGYWQHPVAVQSFAGAKIGANGNWFVVGHGGAYENQDDDRVWMNNPVQANIACAFATGLASSNKTWTSNPAVVAAPKLMAASAPNRRCFLQSIRSGGGAFSKATDSVSVVERYTADATHPVVPAWYIEGTVVQSEPIVATGICLDFPAPSLVDFGPQTLTGPATQTLTSGTGVKFCGLQQITGKFNVDSFSNGAVILPGPQLDGQWTMSVSAGKSAKWRCVK